MAHVHFTQPVSVSVIVPCRNESGYLPEFLNSLLAQERDGIDLECVVADGLSTDGSREILEAFQGAHPEIVVIDNPERIVSTGLNRAILAARGEIIVRMDVHAEYASNYVRKCVDVLQESGADAVGGPTLTRATGLMAEAIAAAFHSAFCVGGARWHNPSYEGPVDTIFPGTWRKTTLVQLGLFDEALVRNQDDELSLRLVRSGGRIWQSRSIVCWYHPRPKLWQLARQYFQYGFWKTVVIAKHRRVASIRHLVPGAFVTAHLSLACALLATVLAGLPRVQQAVAGIWAATCITYLAASVAAAVRASRGKDVRIVAVLPLIFATYHFSYGLGFLLGGCFLLFRRPTHAAGLLADLTR